MNNNIANKEMQKRWCVTSGYQEWYFDELKEAKEKARMYTSSQITEYWGNFKFVRFQMKGHRLIAI